VLAGHPTTTSVFINISADSRTSDAIKLNPTRIELKFFVVVELLR
jgi:hypothetical protein